MGGLDGKVAVVTGAARGIGAVTARCLAEHGAAVVVSDVDAAGAEAVAAELAGAGLAASACPCDVASAQEVEALVAHAERRHGGLDLLDHNAAWTSLRRDTDALGVDLEVWDRVMAVNARGALLLARAAVPAMERRGGGAIVNISSGAATVAEATRVAYGMSKAAVEQLTRHLCTRYGRRNIRANAVAPGLILTATARAALGEDRCQMVEARNPSGRAGTPKDVAEVVAFLLSDAAGYVNGQTVHVDGGLLVAGQLPVDDG